jgi:hypothetical protein
MTRRLCAVVLVLLAVPAFGRAGEKDIIERLRKAGLDVERQQIYGEKDALAVRLVSDQYADTTLAELCELRHLRRLSLYGNRVTDAAMRTVAGLTCLTDLYLDHTAVGDTGLKELKGLRSLKHLSLANTHITDAGLRELAAFPDLEGLGLSGTAVTDAGMKTVGGLGGLKFLVLSGTKVSDAGLVELAGLPALERLYLQDCRGVTDVGVTSLARLRGLRQADLRRTGVTEEGAARLRKALPGCEVIR